MNCLVQLLQCTWSLILYLFFYENRKNPPSKVRYILKKISLLSWLFKKQNPVKFTYSEKAKKLEKSPSLFWRYYVISVAFSEYVNFTVNSLLMQDWVFKLGVGECIFANGANGPDRPSMNLIDITIMLAFVAKDFRPKTRQVLVCCTMWLKNVWMSIL